MYVCSFSLHLVREFRHSSVFQEYFVLALGVCSISLLWLLAAGTWRPRSLPSNVASPASTVLFRKSDVQLCLI